MYSYCITLVRIKPSSSLIISIPLPSFLFHFPDLFPTTPNPSTQKISLHYLLAGRCDVTPPNNVIFKQALHATHLGWSLVIKSTDGSMVHHPAEVSGPARARLTRVHTEVVVTGLGHVAVVIH